MPTTTLENPALPNLHRLFQAINTGDLSVIPDAVTDDFVDHGSPVPLPPGPDGYAQILGFVTQVLDIEYEIQDLFCTEDRICVRSLSRTAGRSPPCTVRRPPASRTRWTACTSTGPRETASPSTGEFGTSSASWCRSGSSRLRSCPCPERSRPLRRAARRPERRA